MDSNKDEQLSEDALEKAPETVNSLDSLSDDGKSTDENAEVSQEGGSPGNQQPGKKKPGKIRRFFRRFNIYLLLFGLILVISGAVFAVSYLNSRKEPPKPTIAIDDLTPSAITKVANEADATIGDARQLLSIQSNTVFGGQVLARSDVNIAGSLRLGSQLEVPNITVGGTSNLGEAQINNLSVANGMIVQGTITTQGDLNIGGSSTFNGPMTASQITTGSLTLSGTGSLKLNNHLSTGGPNLNRTVNRDQVGNGGTVSVSGNDIAGTVNINAGANADPGCLVTIRFSQAYESTPAVILTPTGPGGARMQYYVNRSSQSFSICSANSAPAGSYGFDYFVIE